MNFKSNIIAIGGLKNSGKNEAANMLQYCLNSPKFMHHFWCYKLFRGVFNGYRITSFAHPLKRTLAALLNVPIEMFDLRSFKENTYIYFPTLTMTDHPNSDLVISDNKFSRAIMNKDFSFLTNNYITIRQLLQCFGTEIMRGLFGDNLWILSTLKESGKLIISDLRFKVEAEALKQLNGTLIYINRVGCVPGNHASEKESIELLNTNQFDYVINNDGSLRDLFNKIKAL